MTVEGGGGWGLDQHYNVEVALSLTSLTYAGQLVEIALMILERSEGSDLEWP